MRVKYSRFPPIENDGLETPALLRVREQVLSRRISVRSNRFPGSRDRSKSSHVLKNVRSSVRPGLHYPRVSVPWQGMTSVKNRDPLRWDEVSSHSASRDGLVSSVTISRGAWLVHRSHARLELSLFLVLRRIARDENVGIRENRDSSRRLIRSVAKGSGLRLIYFQRAEAVQGRKVMI